MAISLSFIGGVREVTGSQFLLETDRAKVLVDCGLHQGCHFCEGRNRQPFPYDPSTLDSVIITHAHVDHIGLLPKLVHDGFRGAIVATEPTRDIAEILLEDSARIIAEEAAERREEAPYAPVDVAPTIARFVPVSYRKRQEIAPGVSATFHDAGHVLGSSIVVLDIEGIQVAFSGDLGNPPTPLLPDTETIDAADYLLIESTYGDRIHEDREHRRDIFRSIVRETIERRGVLLIPAFAFERTQELLAELNGFIEHGEIPHVPVFIDSPLAIRTTEIYQRYAAFFNDATREAIARGDAPFSFSGFQVAESRDASKAINDVPNPKIIISGSGMLEGGRILHHARRYLPDPNSTVLITGYQAAGSRGRRLLAKARHLSIGGETVEVRATVKAIGGYSAHADQRQLLAWVEAIRKPPRRVFVTHGEEASAFALREALRERGIDASVPIVGERLLLS